jgi:ferredoxin, 2Fe-2S
MNQSITINFIAAEAGTERRTSTFRSETGQSLMQAAVAVDVTGIEADCGGMLTCATCHVYVQAPFADRLPAPEGEELAMLEFTASPRQPNSRLSCQITLVPELDGLTVQLPPAQH